MKIIVQARVGSSRLHAKILKDVSGKPLLAWMLGRLRGFPVVVATTDEAQSDLIVSIAKEYGASYVKGSVDDVLGRYVLALKDSPEDEIVVRLTSDCPIVDTSIVDKLVKQISSGNLDYVRTGETYPEGMDVEVFRKKHLLTANRECLYPSEREHVTLYIQSNPKKFRLGRDELKNDYGSYRVTVDEAVDFEVVSYVIKKAISLGRIENLSMPDVIKILDENPNIKALNSSVTRNEGLSISLKSENRKIDLYGKLFG